MTTLPKLIENFAKLHANYADATWAWGQCCCASEDFIAYARQCGYEGELKTYEFYADGPHKFQGVMDKDNPAPEVYVVTDSMGRMLRNDVGTVMCAWHCIVDAGHILIDFTARQYRNHYAFPLVIAYEEKMFTQLQQAKAAGAGL